MVKKPLHNNTTSMVSGTSRARSNATDSMKYEIKERRTEKAKKKIRKWKGQQHNGDRELKWTWCAGKRRLANQPSHFPSTPTATTTVLPRREPSDKTLNREVRSTVVDYTVPRLVVSAAILAHDRPHFPPRLCRATFKGRSAVSFASTIHHPESLLLWLALVHRSI